MTSKVPTLILFIASFASASPKPTPVSLPMDAWYSVWQNQKKIGYFFSRYEWTDSQQSQIKYSSTLVRIMQGKFFEEQLQEVSGADMKPVSLRYRKLGDQSEDFTDIDIREGQATIRNKLTLQGQQKTVSLPEGSLFGSFVNFLYLTIKNKMESGRDYAVNVIDEGDFTVKSCQLRLSGKRGYTLQCQDVVGEYEVDPKGLITSQSANHREFEVKKTTMTDAMKGFPKPGERKL